MANFHHKKITIVGAGPVGSLLATLVARRGYEVTVLERRGDMRREAVSAGRSINLAVSVRGIHALQKLESAHQILSRIIPMYGRMMHSREGTLTFQQYGKEKTDCINSLSRGELNEYLLTAAENAGAKIHFHKRVVGVDLNENRLRVRDERNSEERWFSYDHVIGTDGSASQIRKAITSYGGKSSEAELNYGYKELTLPSGNQSEFLMEKNALHIWPRGKFMLIALPNFNGSYTCTLFLPFHGDLSFDSLRSCSEVNEFFQSYFPDAYQMIPGVAEQFFQNPLGHMVTVKCDPWHWSDRVLLMGDAAHAIVPFFGQGMNCGFEDVDLFMQMWDENPNSKDLFRLFGESRRPDSDAIAEMALQNFIEMRDKVGDPKFLLAKEVEQRLQKEYPGQYVSRYQLVSFSRVPYRHAQKLGEVQDRILEELCRGLESATHLDMQRASYLIQTHLNPLMNTLSG